MIGSPLEDPAATTTASAAFELQRPWNRTVARINQPDGVHFITLPGISSMLGRPIVNEESIPRRDIGALMHAHDLPAMSRPSKASQRIRDERPNDASHASWDLVHPPIDVLEPEESSSSVSAVTPPSTSESQEESSAVTDSLPVTPDTGLEHRFVTDSTRSGSESIDIPPALGLCSSTPVVVVQLEESSQPEAVLEFYRRRTKERQRFLGSAGFRYIVSMSISEEEYCDAPLALLSPEVLNTGGVIDDGYGYTHWVNDDLHPVPDHAEIVDWLSKVEESADDLDLSDPSEWKLCVEDVPYEVLQEECRRRLFMSSPSTHEAVPSECDELEDDDVFDSAQPKFNFRLALEQERAAMGKPMTPSDPSRKRKRAYVPSISSSSSGITFCGNPPKRSKLST